MTIEQEQKKLKFNLIEYNLNNEWHSHSLINALREKIFGYFPKSGLYDPQDLEHQVLFRLTTFDPLKITDEVIKNIVEEQYTIMEHRLKSADIDLEYLFRGLSCKYHDLNCQNRLILFREGDKIFAKNSYHTFSVEFKIVNDDSLISLFTNELHYIHQDRPKGETFGFYFNGDKIPWAIETTEPAIISKKYKRDALLAHGIDPNKAIELTRFYTLPGSPLNAISMIDSVVAKYYKKKGIEALFTSTMPMYSKTKSASIAGGINKTLLVKDLKHKFVPVRINNRTCYQQVTNTYIENNNIGDYIESHPNFPMSKTVELYMPINELNIKPLGIFQNKKTIYIKERERKIEKELKFSVSDIAAAVSNIRKIAEFENVLYIKDTIFGCGAKKKIRLRVTDDYKKQNIEAVHKYRLQSDNQVKTEIEEILYQGNNLNEALKSIAEQGDFKEENSYEKIRAVYKENNTEICLDIYPFGVWLEIEGETDSIWETAKKLGYDREEAITLNADELYLKWNKEMKLKELWKVMFGLQKH